MASSLAICVLIFDALSAKGRQNQVLQYILPAKGLSRGGLVLMRVPLAPSVLFRWQLKPQYQLLRLMMPVRQLHKLHLLKTVRLQKLMMSRSKTLWLFCFRRRRNPFRCVMSNWCCRQLIRIKASN